MKNDWGTYHACFVYFNFSKNFLRDLLWLQHIFAVLIRCSMKLKELACETFLPWMRQWSQLNGWMHADFTTHIGRNWLSNSHPDISAKTEVFVRSHPTLLSGRNSNEKTLSLGMATYMTIWWDRDRHDYHVQRRSSDKIKTCTWQIYTQIIWDMLGAA